MDHHDTSRRFMIDDSAIRGEWALLDASYMNVVAKHNYPMELQSMLGQMMAAAVMLSSTIKFDGTLIMQARGGSPVSLITVECTHEKEIRALARWNGDVSNQSFKEMLNGAQLSITVTPKDGERYQGIVPLQGDSLAQCLEHYFQQSEQLKTRIWLTEGDNKAAGLLIQVMPFSSEVKIDDEQMAEDWNRVTLLADTLTAEEHLGINPEGLLFRLFHEEKVRLFEEQPIEFKCNCSKDRFADAIAMLDRDEVDEILKENGNITANCEYCNETYVFDEVDIGALFAMAPAQSSDRQH